MDSASDVEIQCPIGGNAILDLEQLPHTGRLQIATFHHWTPSIPASESEVRLGLHAVRHTATPQSH